MVQVNLYKVDFFYFYTNFKIKYMNLRLVYYYWIPNDGGSNIMNIHHNCLKYYKDIFDEAIFIISIDDLNDKEKLKNTQNLFLSFGFKNIKFKIRQNDPMLRESIVFKEEIMDKLDEYDGLTFFAHSKGNTSHDLELFDFRYISNWITQMYFFCLNDINDVKKCLTDEDYYLTYGGMLMDVPNTASNKYNWYYPGNFYWINGKRLAKYIKDNNIKMPDLLSWSTIQTDEYIKRFYAEDVFGSLFTSERAASSLKKYYEYCDNYRNCDHIREKTSPEIYDEYKRFYKNIALNGVDANKNMICVYAICKNESQNIEKWANSMKEADCIIVLDTGSEDDSVEKLQKCGVRVFQQVINPWRFDAARNCALQYVPDYCNILVSTDLDEYFESGWADIIRKNWKDDDYDLVEYFKYDVYPGINANMANIHSRKFKWIYPVHEELYDGNIDHKILDLSNQIFLHHDRDFNKSRNFYDDLLKLRVIENPNDINGKVFYISFCIENKNYQESIKICYDLLNNYKDKLDTQIKWFIHIKLAEIYIQLNDDENIEKEFNEAIMADEENIDSYIKYADYLYEIKKKTQDGIKILKLGLKKSKNNINWAYKPNGINDVFDILSIYTFYNGDKLESLAYAYKAYSLNPNDERLKNNLNLIVNNMTNEDFL